MTIDINGTISPSNAEANCCYVGGIGYWNSQESASHKMGSQRMGSVGMCLNFSSVSLSLITNDFVLNDSLLSPGDIGYIDMMDNTL